LSKLFTNKLVVWHRITTEANIMPIRDALRK